MPATTWIWKIQFTRIKEELFEPRRKRNRPIRSKWEKFTIFLKKRRERERDYKKEITDCESYFESEVWKRELKRSSLIEFNLNSVTSLVHLDGRKIVEKIIFERSIFFEYWKLDRIAHTFILPSIFLKLKTMWKI